MPKVTDIELCKRGYHGCALADVLTWTANKLYVMDTRGKVIVGDDKIVAEEARLLSEVEAWGDRTLRLFACDCAERVLPLFERRFPDDQRPRQCIETARRYAKGKATNGELIAARAAAWRAASAASTAAWRAASAARAAARTAAWDAGDVGWAAASAARDAAASAAWVAAGAARDAARDAAGAARAARDATWAARDAARTARDAAWVAAGDATWAARDAARDAAGDAGDAGAARDAAWAARETERDWQVQHLAEMLEVTP